MICLLILLLWKWQILSKNLFLRKQTQFAKLKQTNSFSPAGTHKHKHTQWVVLLFLPHFNELQKHTHIHTRLGRMPWNMRPYPTEWYRQLNPRQPSILVRLPYFFLVTLNISISLRIRKMRECNVFIKLCKSKITNWQCLSHSKRRNQQTKKLCGGKVKRNEEKNKWMERFAILMYSLRIDEIK